MTRRSAAPKQQMAASRMYNLPQLSSHAIVSRHFRYVTNATASTGIAGRDFCYSLALGVFNGVASEDLFPLFAAIKVKSIEIWAAPSTNAPVTVSIGVTRVVSDSTYSYETQLEDTSISNANPAHVLWVPKRGEYLYDWVSKTESSSSVLLNCPANSIIEVSLAGIVNMLPGVVSAKSSNTLSSYPTIGFSPLDLNNVAGSRHIIPTSSASDTIWL
jgi:hypothetical protein